MKKQGERAKTAIRKLLIDEECLEEIIEVHETPDYVQVHGKIGGDYVTYRVFSDGNIYEK